MTPNKVLYHQYFMSNQKEIQKSPQKQVQNLLLFSKVTSDRWKRERFLGGFRDSLSLLTIEFKTIFEILRVLAIYRH